MSALLNLISRKVIIFWKIPILTNCRFRLNRKKKEYHIPDAASERIEDADNHLQYSDYKADEIWYYFFFRLHEIYKSGSIQQFSWCYCRYFTHRKITYISGNNEISFYS